MAAENVEISVKGKIMTITVDISKELGPSKSGKSMGIATTGGNAVIEGTKGVTVGLNVYKKIEQE